ncbi:MAG: flagellar hook-basal body complex protein [Planctomycetaceae bacterium]|nr:flagellar hook-basal body complex protein [Planctomycetaceae bacterium]
MNYGFHLATTGAITGMRRLETVANNLANATTVGFKSDFLSMRARLPENLERPGEYADTNTLLDGLGGGTLFDPTRIDLRQGTLRQTKSQFDIAIEGDGFLRLENPAKGAGAKDMLLTRAGALARSATGTLVLATSGVPVLDRNGQRIVLDADQPDLRIDEGGRVMQGGSEIARLAVVVPSDLRNLVKEGRDAMRLLGGRAEQAPDATIVRQYHLEESTVDPVLSLAEMIKVSRGVEFSTRLMQAEDQATGRLIDTLGRFA